MAKLWCPICERSFPNQADMNRHLQKVHSHRVTPENEHLYRRMQNRKWQAREQALDLALRANARAKRLEWADFADHPDSNDVPTTLLDEDLAREMMFVHEIDDDSASGATPLEDESETEDGAVDAATRLSAGARCEKQSHAVVSKRSSSSSDAREESARKQRVTTNNVRRKLVDLEKAAHDYKPGRRLGPLNSRTQQELVGLSGATAEELDDDRSNDADDERESSEESDDAEPRTG